MKNATSEIGDREKTQVVPQAVQEAQALKARRAPGKPSEGDKKDAWEAYAESIGIDTSGMTKAQIIEAAG